MEMFNERVRRIANLRAYEERIDDIAIELCDGMTMTEFRLLVVCADMFLTYIPFDLPQRTEPTSPVSGEFTAR